jgi:hypothetical protein
MAITSQFELALWQSISRHLDIAESTESTAALLADHVPLKSLITRRLEPEHRRVRIAAHWPSDSMNRSVAEIQVPEAAWGRLERWMRQKTVLHAAADGAKAKALLELLQIPDAAGDWLVAPLVGEHGSRGVLAAWAGTKHRFSAPDVKHFEAALEPMGIALDNDARLHELAALREAAEAERQSLLRRLGRTDTGEKIVRSAGPHLG